MKIILQLAMLQFLGLFLVYTASQAAPAKVIAGALSSSVVAEMEAQFPKNISVSLKKVEEIAAYRCINCYDLKLSYQGASTATGKAIKFSKLLSIRGDLHNTLVVREIKP